MIHKEDSLEEQVAKYLQLQYPTVIFRFDSSAGANKTMFQALRSKKLHGHFSRGYPDLLILEKSRGFGACFIELKALGSSPYRVDGSLRQSKHIQTQNAYHGLLRDRGYYATFATGFLEAKEIIDGYLKGIL